jgi:hypothetical protein
MAQPFREATHRARNLSEGKAAGSREEVESFRYRRQTDRRRRVPTVEDDPQRKVAVAYVAIDTAAASAAECAAAVSAAPISAKGS